MYLNLNKHSILKLRSTMYNYIVFHPLTPTPLASRNVIIELKHYARKSNVDYIIIY